jgi:hypothetical protein
MAAVIGDGLTLRDYFAAKALQALIAMPIESDIVQKHTDRWGEFDREGYLADQAYGYAQAMLTAGERWAEMFDYDDVGSEGEEA